MKYFLDTEFIEGWKKPISWLPTIGNFNKKYHSIQLISVGIVAEDGREYYAVSNEFNPRDASEWVKKNVLHGIEIKMYQQLTPAEKSYRYVGKGEHPGFAYLLSRFGKSNKQIAEEIIEFCDPTPIEKRVFTNPEFYAYYADYDWVVFCSLFGTMMDLPKGFPMYCKDLKQMLDEKVSDFENTHLMKFEFAGNKMEMKDVMTNDFNSKLSAVKNMKDYPKQQNEHNALDDAKWNYKLFSFIKNLK